jgi:lipid-A-disaccharide synthase
MRDPVDYFILAAEASGDLLGFHLMQQLMQTHPHVKIAGVFGPKMRQLGFTQVLGIEDFQVMGFIDVFKNLKKLIRSFFFLRNFLLKNPPQKLILIDYPGFNLRLAKSLKKHKFPSPIIQYVCPSIWAWKYNRVHFLKRWIDEVWCLFPFEPLYLSKAGVNCRYVGHPLFKALDFPKASLPERSPLILIFPGSRSSEIKKNLTIMLEAALETSEDYKIGISAASPEALQLIETKKAAYSSSRLFIFPSEENSMLMEQASIAIATSGTITLELALHHLPTLVCYKLSLFDHLLAKYFLKIHLPFYCIVNFLALEEIFPEFYGYHLSKDLLSASIQKYLSSFSHLEDMYSKTFILQRLLKTSEESACVSGLLK